jgi:hypothetical protein
MKKTEVTIVGLKNRPKKSCGFDSISKVKTATCIKRVYKRPRLFRFLGSNVQEQKKQKQTNIQNTLRESANGNCGCPTSFFKNQNLFLIMRRLLVGSSSRLLSSLWELMMGR